MLFIISYYEGNANEHDESIHLIHTCKMAAMQKEVSNFGENKMQKKELFWGIIK